MRRSDPHQSTVAPLSRAFVVFDRQDSGCLSYGVDSPGGRVLVKTPTTTAGAESLRQALRVHAAVRHPAIVAPIAAFDGPTLVYPWRDGVMLNAATIDGPDRSGLRRFQQLPVAEVREAIDTVIDAHLAVAAAGLVPVDLYDGCLRYDFASHRMWLIDLDHYRPGPFVLTTDRLPGSLRYMAPEEFVRGATIDERTGGYSLGRVAHHLLDSVDGWRGDEAERRVVQRATAAAPADRYPDIRAFVAAWTAAAGTTAGGT